MTTLQLILFTAILSKFIFELFLANLNLRRIRHQKILVPREGLLYMNEEEWAKCSDYTISKTHFSLFENFYSFLISTVTLFYFLPVFYDKWSMHFGFGLLESSIATTGILLLIQQIGLPLDWFRQFRLEERFGFNNQSTRLWITDKIKEFILGALLLIIVMSLLHLLYDQISGLSPDYWWIFAFFALFLFQIILMVIWPRFVLPLFNELKPLNDSELSSRLGILSEKTGFKTQEIQVMDGSKRSAHSNAFFTGFGKFRKIVLFDTLISQMGKCEIIAVVAHEIGHYKLGHIPKRLVISFCMGLFFFFLIAQSIESSWFVKQLNIPSLFAGEIGPVFLAFVLFGGSITYWFIPFSNYFSRRHEFEADDYAVSMTESSTHLSSALKKLSAKNLSYPLPHPWVSFFYHSHPTLPERDLNISRDKTTE